METPEPEIQLSATVVDGSTRPSAQTLATSDNSFAFIEAQLPLSTDKNAQVPPSSGTSPSQLAKPKFSNTTQNPPVSRLSKAISFHPIEIVKKSASSSLSKALILEREPSRFFSDQPKNPQDYLSHRDTYAPVPTLDVPEVSKDATTREYLMAVLGRVLSSCLVELCQQRPQDPIDFLARWLYRYADSRLYMQEKAEFLKRVTAVAEQLRQERRLRLARMRGMLDQMSGLVSRLFPFTTSTAALVAGIDLVRRHTIFGALKEADGNRESMERALGLGRDTCPAPMQKEITRLTQRMHKISLSARIPQSQINLESRSDDGDRSPSVRSMRRNRGSEGSGEDGYSSSNESWRGDEDSVSRAERRSRKSSERSSRNRTSGADEQDELGEETEEEREQRLAREKQRQREQLHRKPSLPRVEWKYERQYGRIVCIHSQLGILAARPPSWPEEDLLRWLSGELTCLSLYESETYACLPDSMLYHSAEHVEQMPEPKTAGKVKRARSNIKKEQGKDETQTANNVAGTSCRDIKKETVEIRKDDDFNDADDDDDVRWQPCMESWKLCEGFEKDRSGGQ